MFAWLRRWIDDYCRLSASIRDHEGGGYRISPPSLARMREQARRPPPGAPR